MNEELKYNINCLEYKDLNKKQRLLYKILDKEINDRIINNTNTNFEIIVQGLAGSGKTAAILLLLKK